MDLKTYKIIGDVTYNEAETEDGFDTVEIDEFVEGSTAIAAFENFMEDNRQYDFFGHCTDVDAETRGGVWAVFQDRNKGQRIFVETI